MKALSKYFETYAEPEISLLSNLRLPIWNEALVIPARVEDDLFFSCLQSVERAATLAETKVLAIVVVNGSKEELEQNQRILSRLNARPLAEGIGLVSNLYSDWLVVDRATPPRQFNEKEGVGLARKIGCDIALWLIHLGNIRSPWIRNTDADVLLPEDYFLHLEAHEPSNTVGFIYDFVHNSQPLGHLSPALDIYDLSLRYYVGGLKWAQSPYAFHTIGSTIVVHSKAYAEVRGFPKREAGEDFYILNKLAKIGKIEESLGSPIQIQGRLSKRTPFGTGNRVSDFASRLMEGQDILFYNPKTFVVLKEWLEILDAFSRSSTQLESHLKGSEFRNLSAPVLEAMGALDGISRLKERAHSPEIRLKNFHTWFDGFKTLKFIHALRDSSLPSLPMERALELFAQLTEDKTLSYKASETFEQQRNL